MSYPWIASAIEWRWKATYFYKSGLEKVDQLVVIQVNVAIIETSENFSASDHSKAESKKTIEMKL